MARDLNPKCKQCRRAKEKLFLKGDRCNSPKCAMIKKAYAPGMHGQKMTRGLSEYGKQLAMKQRIKRIYGVLETPFRNYFAKANRQSGPTGENLLKLLERRLDNVVYRLGFAPSRKAARQLVLHRHFLVNGKKVNIPSYLLRPGDVISVREKSKKLDIIHSSLRGVKDNPYPWLSVNKAELSGTFNEIPERDDIPVNVNEQYVVELYSK